MRTMDPILFQTAVEATSSAFRVIKQSWYINCLFLIYDEIEKYLLFIFVFVYKNCPEGQVFYKTDEKCKDTSLMKSCTGT